MKHYKAYTAKKFKLPRRIIFFAVVAVLIFAVTVIIGNVLKKRVDNNEIDTSEITEPAGDKTDFTLDGTTVSVPHDGALASVAAGYLDLSGISDAEGARAAVQDLRSAGYNAAAVVIFDGDGMLSYASKAAESASGLKASEKLVPYEVLKAAVSEAGDLGIRSIAVADCGAKLLPDIAAELSALGFNEILLRGFESLDALSADAVSQINAAISSVSAENMTVGVCLSSEIYLAAQNSPYIEKLYTAAHYLAIDLTSATPESAGETAERLQGSFSAYLLRAVLDGRNAENAAAVKSALQNGGVKAYTYISAPPHTQETTDEGTDG